MVTSANAMQQPLYNPADALGGAASPPASAPPTADTKTPSAAATPEQPPPPHKAPGDSSSQRAGSVSPCVTEAAARLSLQSPPRQVCGCDAMQLYPRHGLCLLRLHMPAMYRDPVRTVLNRESSPDVCRQCLQARWAQVAAAALAVSSPGRCALPSASTPQGRLQTCSRARRRMARRPLQLLAVLPQRVPLQMLQVWALQRLTQLQPLLMRR